MARKRNRNNTYTPTTTEEVLKSLNEMNVKDLDVLHSSIPDLISSKVDKQLNSSDISSVMSVVDFMKSKKKDEVQSVFFNPFSVSSGSDYKPSIGNASFDTLQKMGNIHVVKAIVNTRVEQVQNFLKFTTDQQVEGFTIRKKRSLFDESAQELTELDKKNISDIVDFLENGGYTDKWELHDSFQDFIRKITRDSLVLDQLAFEIVRDRSLEMQKFTAVDASLIRILNSVDPRFKEQFEKYRYRGYLPRYGMVYNQQILHNPETEEPILYYPWELGFGVRNSTTDINRNGYGVPELETLLYIMTCILWGFEYNGNFFKQGSQPKGFINVKGSNIDNATLNEFRQAWNQTMRGVGNSHRTPILQGMDLEWIDLQMSNRDMEFTEWTKFLIIITCSVYRIDPSELGFEFEGASRMFGQDGQRERLQHSRSKGLKPLLIFLQNIINRYLVSELFDGDYEFVFTGIDVEDEERQVRLDKEKLESGMVSLEDMFEKYSGREFDPNVDTILNQVYQTARQTSMLGGSGMNSIVDDMDSENENPFTVESNSSNPFEQSNPILEKALDYIDKTWNNGN